MVASRQTAIISDDDQIFQDTYAIFSKWDSLLLKVQALLIWEKFMPSLIFNAGVHLMFWLIVLSKHSFLSLFCYFLLFLVACDFLSHRLTFLTDDTGAHDTFTHFVKSALENGYILSTEELSRRFAGLIYRLMLVLNRLAPPNRNRRFISFLMTSLLSVACIVLGRSISGRSLCYGLLNSLLVYPALLHYRLLERLSVVVHRVMSRLEAEFDRYPLELQSDREADEAAFYEPIVAAAKAEGHASQLQGHGSWFDRSAARGNPSNGDWPAGNGREDHEFALDNLVVDEAAQEGNNSDDLSTSEAAFINQFVPKLTNNEIDRLFTDALSGKLPASKTSAAADLHQRRQQPEPSSNTSRSSSLEAPIHVPTMMLDEYATDEDEQSIEEEEEEEVVLPGQNEQQNSSPPTADDFVFLAQTPE